MTSMGDAGLKPRRRFTAALAAGLLVLTGCQARTGQGGARPAMLGDYSEERLAPNHWSVSASGRTQERARDLALYRGAVLIRAGGYSHVRVVSFRTEGFDYANASIPTKFGEIDRPAVPPVRTAFAQVIGTNDPAAPFACDVPATTADLCRNMPIDEALAAFGQRLGLTPDQSAAEVDAARRALAARPRGG